MKKIESFKINHLTLKPGLYLSRVDTINNCCITTFDLRLIAPNRDKVMDTGTMHTVEHIGATYFRNSTIKKNVIYFGPMGCRTGFYLVLFGKYKPKDIMGFVKKLCSFIIVFEGKIPGASPKECGNYLDQNLPSAKNYMKNYLNELELFNRTEYPA